MKYINQLIEKLEEKNIDIISCSDKEIEDIIQKFEGLELPLAYKEFIFNLGNGMKSGYMRGDSCYIDELFYLRDWANELLEERNSKLELSENDFVFWMSQGCMFCFFKLNEGENPPVYFYNESGEDRFITTANSFTEFLINRLEMNGSLFKEKE